MDTGLHAHDGARNMPRIGDQIPAGLIPSLNVTSRGAVVMDLHSNTTGKLVSKFMLCAPSSKELQQSWSDQLCRFFNDYKQLSRRYSGVHGVYKMQSSHYVRLPRRTKHLNLICQGGESSILDCRANLHHATCATTLTVQQCNNDELPEVYSTYGKEVIQFGCDHYECYKTCGLPGMYCRLTIGTEHQCLVDSDCFNKASYGECTSFCWW